ncbi:hypothetical protein [Paenibacillus larvae]|uniref:Uncharacterized protein n=1 Tax=Paenibacillus larvae subsp. larvae TaxID=147375 RepID=A0A2L1U458_9BACL|nr:hypothetical protein [Paenibacillus larvae]AVF27694.1 hypothetical protein ERICIII_03584 [Paenibacillus larvae subsp. larvae]MCY7521288.1 hypothetical protein [Paenibacillus larvae]MCY9502864.1 hypothetical protein [Paenibacillus larvae]MCY9679813.1 hypothetical protein [Paenibacillus larvae]MCY9745729.1 hypothetical protein [Paenibacillus larvae]
MIALAWILAVLYSLNTGLSVAGIIWGKDASIRVANAIIASMTGLVVYFMISFLRM